MKARLLAYYLPQYHPIPENDQWWGKGFTEWTNVAKAKPLFRGHWQPHLPADLGFYDLRVPEIREAQAELARDHGIEGFIYYHYWFGEGRRLLERPFNEVLKSGKPDFPFCLCWANHTWSGVWYGESDRVLMEQRYGGREDFERHFDVLLPAFLDERYVRVDGRPLFQILFPKQIPNVRELTDLFRELAQMNGLPGLYLVGGPAEDSQWSHSAAGLDAPLSDALSISLQRMLKGRQGIKNRIVHHRWINRFGILKQVLDSQVPVIQYRDLIKNMELNGKFKFEIVPCVLPNWDNTPRSGSRGLVVQNSTPDLFKAHLKNAIDFVQEYCPEHRLVFIKSWNEWAEGNYLEPDSKFGLQYLEAVRESAL